MKLLMLVKRLNNTELYRRGTNDSYIRIPNNVDWKLIFNTDEEFQYFKDKRDGEVFKVRHRERDVGGNVEHRFDKLGDYYRKYGFNAGDAILFERRSSLDNEEYYIDHVKFNSIFMLKSRRGFELLSDGLNIDEHDDTIIIEEIGWFKKKANSRNETLFYDLLIDGESQISHYSHDDMIEIKRKNGCSYISLVNKCRVYKIEI